MPKVLEDLDRETLINTLCIKAFLSMGWRRAMTLIPVSLELVAERNNPQVAVSARAPLRRSTSALARKRWDGFQEKCRLGERRNVAEAKPRQPY